VKDVPFEEPRESARGQAACDKVLLGFVVPEWQTCHSICDLVEDVEWDVGKRHREVEWMEVVMIEEKILQTSHRRNSIY